MSLATAPPDEDDVCINLESVIHSFIHAYPDPSDEQVHTFAELLGLDKGVFEEHMFALFGEELDEVDDLPDAIEDLSPIDRWICTYFAYRETPPTEEEVHALARILGMTPESFEEHVYALMTDLELEDDLESTDLETLESTS